MRNTYLIVIVLFTMMSCDNSSKIKEKELQLKQKELELKERELALKEASTQKNQTKSNPTEEQKKIERKKLRYLYYSNGGLIGYFSDGIIAGCPRCDLLKENVEYLTTGDVLRTYTVAPNGSLILNNGDQETPTAKNNNIGEGWAVIDYKWYVDINKLQ